MMAVNTASGPHKEMLKFFEDRRRLTEVRNLIIKDGEGELIFAARDQKSQRIWQEWSLHASPYHDYAFDVTMLMQLWLRKRGTKVLTASMARVALKMARVNFFDKTKIEEDRLLEAIGIVCSCWLHGQSLGQFIRDQQVRFAEDGRLVDLDWHRMTTLVGGYLAA